MQFFIKHSIDGRIRIHLKQTCMTLHQADLLLYYLTSLEEVEKAKVYQRTADAVIYYRGEKSKMIDSVRKFSYEKIEALKQVPSDTGRELSNVYQEKLVTAVFLRACSRIFLPAPIRNVITVVRAVRFIWKGFKILLKGKLKVEVLDAVAILVSILRKDYKTAGSVMFLLGIGELLEEWTHKKSVDDLARSMSLNVEKVWIVNDDTQILVPITDVKQGDLAVVHMGNMIPVDGVVMTGEAMINQSSMTGESMPVKKEKGGYVYAGTFIEEGEVTIQVKSSLKSTRYEKIIRMIEESEKLKSSLEGKAENLADKLIPYSFLGTIGTYLVTRNVQKALSILMVDFSCALKLAMPLAVLSAMRECSDYHITVKGGKYLESVAGAATVVFDKTGTLTKAEPVVADIITFGDNSKSEMLRIAACLEEHFPHSMANAVIEEAKRQNLEHNEMHSKVEYIVAHGISSYINGEKVVIGSSHFVFEDETCIIPENEHDKFEQCEEQYSHLYLAISGVLSAIICIEDPLREEASYVIQSLKEAGVKKVVMMTGDSERTACAVAKEVGVDEYYSEVLPEDKAAFIEQEKEKGNCVIMIGDGINDSPALSAANVGIAISDGAQIAREIADITITADNLRELLTLKKVSDALMKRVNYNYKFVIGFNFSLIALGVAGFITPATSALLHNMSTLMISLKSVTNLLDVT